MKADEFHALLGARPFQPFAIHLGDGRELAVDHPEFLAVSPAGDVAVVFRPEGGLNLVDVSLVTDLEVKDRPQSRRSDGENT